MTYARSRLWLGISGVGSLVLICLATLLLQLPNRLFQATTAPVEVLQLGSITLLLFAWMMPFDLLGGYWLPKKFKRSFESFRSWLSRYLVFACLQALLFTSFAGLILFAGRQFGTLGVVVVILIAIGLCTLIRNVIWYWRRVTSPWARIKLSAAVLHADSWGFDLPKIMVVTHKDIGFTGGVIGFGKRAVIVIPKAWLDALSSAELATMLARRSTAISSGSYTKGCIIALCWNCGGFLAASLLPGAGWDSVGQLATTFCGFTLWTFVGLLILPTLSRNASLQIDHELHNRGLPPNLIWRSAKSFDQLQDDEPRRPRIIETIFHPLPSVDRRRPQQSVRGLAAWNVARTTIFFSWGCVGFLSRAVHCNVGRPELWTMLPTD